MALSVEKTQTEVKLSIPLASSRDDKWKDNSWIVEHLRHLADKIEETQFKIYGIGIEMDAQYKTPNLVITGSAPREWEIIEVPKLTAERIEELGNLSQDLLDIFNNLENKNDIDTILDANILKTKYAVSVQEINWFVNELKFGTHPDLFLALMLAQKNIKKEIKNV